MNLRVSQIGKDEYPQLCFVKRTRQKGKTSYTFFSVSLSKEVSKELMKWLLSNIDKAESKQLSEYNPSSDVDEMERINLSKVDKWQCVVDHGVQVTTTKIADLKTIKNHLAAFIIYVKTEEYVVGQIRKITPKSVLNRKGLFKLFFNNQTFNEIREDIGLQIDDVADLLFVHYYNGYSYGVIFNKKHFRDIFDMHEQEKKEAMTRFNSLELLSKSKYGPKIKDMIEGDRRLQRMIINPVIQEYMSSFTFDMLVELKQKVRDGVAYQIDQENSDFILPEGKEKEALKDILKAMSGRYSKDLKGQHIIENVHVKRIIK